MVSTVIEQAVIFHPADELLFFDLNKTVSNIKPPAEKSSGTAFVLFTRLVLFG
jgi:hypothetical protein